MEVKDSTEVPNSKAGTRSRSSSKELSKNDLTETSDDASENLTKNIDSDLPNGAEPHENSKDNQGEDEEEEEEEEEVKKEEQEENSPVKMETDEAIEGKQDDVGMENELPDEEPVKDSPVDFDSVPLEASPVKEENNVDNIGGSNGEISVKAESNFDDDDGETDSSSENSNLNIDTSGSSAPSERAYSEKEEVPEEIEIVKIEDPVVKIEDPVVKIENTVKVEDEYHSDDSEDFVGFVEETSDVHSILQRIIEKLELEESDSEDNESEWNTSFDSEVAGSSSEKLVSLLNYEDLKSITNRWPRKSSKDSFNFAASISSDRSPGSLDAGNPENMVAGEDVASSIASSSPSLGGGASGRGKKVHVDLTNPAFRKPMELGWKRELVYRNTVEVSGSKRNADIYYYTPLGKKVRSNREVIENLVGDELTLDNFTFFKEPLGLEDPTKEIIRDAKRVATKEPIGAPPKKMAKFSKTATPPKEPQVKEEPIPEQHAKPVVILFKDTKDNGRVPSPKEPSPVPRTAAPSPKLKPPRTFPRVKVTPLRNQRKSQQNVAPNTTPTMKSASCSRSKKDSNTSGELVMGMLPPQWKDPSALPNNKKTVPLTPVDSVVSTSSPATPVLPISTTTTKTTSRQTAPKEDIPEEVRAKKLESERQFMQFFMQNLGAGYTALGQVFQYLKVQELLRAGRVCRMWKDLASQASLWRTVRMKNSQVVNWKGCADALRRYGTEELDLRKMLIPGKANAMWDEFCSVVGTIPSLRRLELCKCPADVLDRISVPCQQLQSITALSIKCASINLNFVQNFKNLQELRLKSIQGIDLLCSLEVLKNLDNLKHLSLTTFREFGRKEPNVIGSLTTLETLELGDFCDFPESFGQSLTNLKNLQRLRLEKGQGKMCPTFKVLAGIRTLPRLTQLELVNFDIKPGFDVALEQCTNIRRLLIIPTYVSQSATTNHMVLGGVTKLGSSLVVFVWGVTHELLRVTELFVDQCEGQKGARVAPKDNKKNGTSDSIPVLKPVPGLVAEALCDNGSDNKSTDSNKHKAPKEENVSEDNKTSAATQQVDILPLSKLQTLLTNALPNTKVTILKIPFHATWRQSIGDYSR